MSWQAYIDTSLVGTGTVNEAAIFSKDGKDSWAVSSGFKITPDEIKSIIAGFANADPLWAEGFRVNGEKYMLIRADENSVIGKKGKEGIIAVRTKQALIIAHHPEDVLTQSCTNTVESLATYLADQGY